MSAMRVVRFQTDIRWWILLSAILFLLSLWVQWVPVEFPGEALLTPARFGLIILDLHKTNPDLPIDFAHYHWLFAMMICASGVVATLIGWALQCALVILRTIFVTWQKGLKT